MTGRGGKRAGAGRPKGSPNKATARMIAGIAESGLTPLEYLLQVLQDERKATDELIRRVAAIMAANGSYPRGREAGENGGQPPGLTNQGGSDDAVSTAEKQRHRPAPPALAG